MYKGKSTSTVESLKDSTPNKRFSTNNVIRSPKEHKKRIKNIDKIISPRGFISNYVNKSETSGYQKHNNFYPNENYPRKVNIRPMFSPDRDIVRRDIENLLFRNNLNRVEIIDDEEYDDEDDEMFLQEQRELEIKNIEESSVYGGSSIYDSEIESCLPLENVSETINSIKKHAIHNRSTDKVGNFSENNIDQNIINRSNQQQNNTKKEVKTQKSPMLQQSSKGVLNQSLPDKLVFKQKKLTKTANKTLPSTPGEPRRGSPGDLVQSPRSDLNKISLDDSSNSVVQERDIQRIDGVSSKNITNVNEISLPNKSYKKSVQDQNLETQSLNYDSGSPKNYMEKKIQFPILPSVKTVKGQSPDSLLSAKSFIPLNVSNEKENPMVSTSPTKGNMMQDISVSIDNENKSNDPIEYSISKPQNQIIETIVNPLKDQNIDIEETSINSKQIQNNDNKEYNGFGETEINKNSVEIDDPTIEYNTINKNQKKISSERKNSNKIHSNTTNLDTSESPINSNNIIVKNSKIEDINPEDLHCITFGDINSKNINPTMISSQTVPMDSGSNQSSDMARKSVREKNNISTNMSSPKRESLGGTNKISTDRSSPKRQLSGKTNNNKKIEPQISPEYTKTSIEESETMSPADRLAPYVAKSKINNNEVSYINNNDKVVSHPSTTGNETRLFESLSGIYFDVINRRIHNLDSKDNFLELKWGNRISVLQFYSIMELIGRNPDVVNTDKDGSATWIITQTDYNNKHNIDLDMLKIITEIYVRDNTDVSYIPFPHICCIEIKFYLPGLTSKIVRDVTGDASYNENRGELSVYSDTYYDIIILVACIKLYSSGRYYQYEIIEYYRQWFYANSDYVDETYIGDNMILSANRSKRFMQELENYILGK